MADKQTTVKFSAVDGGLSLFMKKLQTESKNLYKNLSEEATKQGIKDKEQNKFIQERIKLLQEELKYKKQIAQENLKTAQEGFRFATTDEDIKGMKKYVSMIEDQKRAIEQLNRDQSVARGAGRQGNPQQEQNITKQIIAGILTAGLVKDILGTLSHTASASTGLQLLTPMARSIGTGAASLLSLGMSPGATATGGAVGEYLGTAYTRHIIARYGLEGSQARYRALTGQNIGGSYSNLGYSQEQAVSEAGGFSRSRGNGITRDDLKNLLGLGRGFGIEQGSLQESLGGERLGGGNAILRMQKTLGIGIAEGLDRAKFTDAIKNSNQLISQFAQTVTHVNSDRVNQLLFEFNKMGGSFKIGDPRSLERISALNASLASPNSPFNQALNYSVLRGLPQGQNASVFNLVGMQEQGLQTPGFLKGVIDQYKKMGVSEDFQKLMFKSRTGMNNQDINTIFENYGGLETMTKDQLNKMLKTPEITKAGEVGVGTLPKLEAQVQDAFVKGMTDGISVVAKQFGDAMTKAIEDAVTKKLGMNGGTETMTPRLEAIPFFSNFGSKDSKSSQKKGK